MFQHNLNETAGAVVKQSLLDFVTESVVTSGSPLTPGAVLDLLATTRITDMIRMDSKSALLADKIHPAQLAFASFDEPVYRLADKQVTINGVRTTVFQAVQDGLPVDFVLASLKLPDIVARYYVVFYMDKNPVSVWPETPAGLANLRTRFDLGYLHEAVGLFLENDGEGMVEEWLALFGLGCHVKVNVFDGMSNAEILDTIRHKILVPKPEPALISPEAAQLLVKAATVFKVTSFDHFLEAKTIVHAYDTVVKAVKMYKADVDTLVKHLTEEVSK